MTLPGAFVDSVTEVLVKKTVKALKKTGYKSLVVTGGVSAKQTTAREGLIKACKKIGVKVYFPPLAFMHG